MIAIRFRSVHPAASLVAFIISVFVTLPAAGQPAARPLQAAATPLAPELDGLGPLDYRVTTANPQAQRFFNQGLRLLYAFNHAEALRAFREASRLDPQLAMAHWGQAMALGPNLNAPMTVENGRLAYEAIRRAAALSSSATEPERGLIAALGTRYARNGAGDAKALGRKYADAMTLLAQRFPDDPEVQIVYADAVMNTIAWDYWRPDGSFKPDATPILAALERVIARHPEHPGAHHYYIHLVEGSATPERAEASADRLGTLMPAAGHMVHMPAHIYLRVGRYADAAEANVKAIAADEDYLAQCQAQGLYPVSYYPHNLHFLWAAATLEGRRAVAIDAAREVAQKVPHHHAGALAWTADFPVTPLLAYARFGAWKEILTEPSPPAREPYAVGIWRYARGLAFIAQDRLDRAESELSELRRIMQHEAFKTTLKDLPLLTNLQIASRIVEGELAGRRGRYDEAVRALEAAVTLEDGIPYNEPPVWHQPTRQVLGALLIEGGRPADAERVYRADLVRFRENGWSLFGLAQSLDAQQRTTEAAQVRERFTRAWARADITLTSSRILSAAPAVTTAQTIKSVTLPNGIAIEYVEQGDASGTPLVLLHGYTDSWRSFADVLPLLPPSVHAFAISQRGHGGSSRPAAGYAMSDFAADVRSFLDAVNVRSAIVVGHSMGSLVAQRFALDYPERTAGLVLMGTFAAVPGNGAVQALAADVATLVDPVPRPFIEAFQLSTVAQPIPAASLATFVGESQRLPAHVWREALNGVLTVDYREELARVPVPTLVVWGDRDTVSPKADQEALARVIPQATLRVYEGAGHSFHWEDPARFAGDLVTFIGRAGMHSGHGAAHGTAAGR